jgi:hypothetical protein
MGRSAEAREALLNDLQIGAAIRLVQLQFAPCHRCLGDSAAARCVYVAVLQRDALQSGPPAASCGWGSVAVGRIAFKVFAY